MDDREHVHPLALAVLDANWDGEWTEAFDAWHEVGAPILNARASRVLAIIQEYMDDCDSCALRGTCPSGDDPGMNACARNMHADIRRAWTKGE